eukprot:Gb_41679 [translate_table: standard]
MHLQSLLQISFLAMTIDKQKIGKGTRNQTNG